MQKRTDNATPAPPSNITVRIAARSEVAGSPRWQSAFARERKDHRYYELLEDTLTDGFRYGYLKIEADHTLTAIQPYFVLDQDLLAGMSGLATKLVGGIRRLWPRFMYARTLMVGCTAGEGHLDGDEKCQSMTAEALARSLPRLARELSCAMIVFKEFPSKYRQPMESLCEAGYARVPSMPMTTLDIGYKNFEDYLSRLLSPRTRGKVRRKLRVAERAQPAIVMSVMSDVTPVIDEIYPLYEKVFDRSPLRFEKLTRQFLCEIGRRMPDKVRFFIWRQDTRIIAFGLCMVQNENISHDYVGFDYSVAFELNLYYRVFHDIIEWAIAHGYKRFYSGSLNYDPKWHLRQSLYPVDLYVRHNSRPVNALLKRLLPLLEPTRADPILPHFHNYSELWK
jgi:hypothetical protein